MVSRVELEAEKDALLNRALETLEAVRDWHAAAPVHGMRQMEAALVPPFPLDSVMELIDDLKDLETEND